MADTYIEIRHFTAQRTPATSPSDPAYDFSEALEFERQTEGDDKLLRSIICHPVEVSTEDAHPRRRAGTDPQEIAS